MDRPRQSSGTVSANGVHKIHKYQGRAIGAAPPRTATERTLAIIDLVLSAESPLAAKMIGAALGLPKATAHRLLGALEEKGLLLKHPLTGVYGPGPNLCDMAFKIVQKSSASSLRHAVLADLAATSGESCNLGMLHGNEARYLDRVEANFPLKLDFRPGSCVPLYCSAMGKIFLSAMPPVQLGRYLESVTLRPHTQATKIDLAELRDELDKVHKQGFSQDDEEYVAGVNCLAVPVPVPRSQHVLALAIQAPKSRLTLDRLMVFLPTLQEAAAKMSRVIEGEAPVQKSASSRRDG